MNRFDDQITAVLEELARDPKDARNRKVISDALLLAYRKGKVEARMVDDTPAKGCVDALGLW